MEWSNQKILVFLELLKAERAIWDPNDKHHKFKRRVDEAWRRISSRLDNTPVNELKAKKRSLMATFRPLLKKKIISVMSGAISDEDVYQPTWFAYNILESFMGFIYDEWSIKMENGNQQNEETSDQEHEHDTMNDRDDDSTNDHDDDQTEDDSRRNGEDKKTNRLKRYRDSIKTNSDVRTNFEAEIAQKNINDSFRTLNKVLDRKKEEDDCDLYAKLLAKKLRKYPGNMRLKLMYSIDGLLIDNPYPAGTSNSVASYSISSSSTHPLPADPLCIYAPESSNVKPTDNNDINLNME